jgi:6-phosphogluconolactonase
MSSRPEIRILGSADELFRAAAGEFSAQASAAVSAHGRFTVALSGGSTPKGLYNLLATTAAIPWQKIFFFWGDERHVPHDDPESNFRTAQETLLSKVPVNPQNIFRIHAEEKDAQAVARAYGQTIASFFQLRTGEFPRFDLVLLGIGTDGHTASLFPGTKALQERKRLVFANWVEGLNSYRITMTFPVLNQAAFVMFLVSGADKSEIVSQILKNPQAHLPSQKIAPLDGRLLWLLDSAAAARLSSVQTDR